MLIHSVSFYSFCYIIVQIQRGIITTLLIEVSSRNVVSVVAKQENNSFSSQFGK